MSDWEGPGTTVVLDPPATQVRTPVSGGVPPKAPPATDAPEPKGGGAPIWVLVALALAAAAIAGTAVYLLNAGQGPKLEAQIAALRTRNAQLESQVNALTETVKSVEASASAAASAAAGASRSGGTSATTAAKPVTQFTYITKVTWSSSGGYKLTADYAQMLTGKAAADAATAHGSESPPPNDFFIVNDSKKLRTLTLSKTAKIVVLGWGGTDATAPKNLTVGQFMDVMNGGTNPQEPWKSAPYTITLSGSTVTRVQQVYIP